MKIALARKHLMASAVTAALLAGIFGTGAVVAQSRDDAPPPGVEWDKRRLERLERNVRRLENQLTRNRDPNAPLTIIETDPEVAALTARFNEMNDKLSDMESTVRRLNGELEEANMALARAREEAVASRNELGPLRTRIAELETRLSTLEAGPGVGSEEAAVDPQIEYDAALKLVNDGSLIEGGRAFEAFIAKYPEAPQTPEAHYRLAETLYNRDETELAVASYSRSLKGWPQARWAAEATLKLATSLANIERFPQACAAVAEFDKRYAATSSANARNRAASIKTRARCG